MRALCIFPAKKPLAPSRDVLWRQVFCHVVFKKIKLFKQKCLAMMQFLLYNGFAYVLDAASMRHEGVLCFGARIPRHELWIAKCYNFQTKDCMAVSLEIKKCIYLRCKAQKFMLKKSKSCITKIITAFRMVAILVSSVGITTVFAMEADNPGIVPPNFDSDTGMHYDTYVDWEDVEVFAIPKLVLNIIKTLLGIDLGKLLST